MNSGRKRRCIDLEDRFRITAIRMLEDFFVNPASATVASPYCSSNQPTGDRSPRNEHTPEMPSIWPRLPQI